MISFDTRHNEIILFTRTGQVKSFFELKKIVTKEVKKSNLDLDFIFKKREILGNSSKATFQILRGGK